VQYSFCHYWHTQYLDTRLIQPFYSGTQLDRNDLEPSPAATTEVRLQLLILLGAHGIIIVYDVTDRDSFDNVRQWMHEIER
jgi:GTPase SAR1 family protein